MPGADDGGTQHPPHGPEAESRAAQRRKYVTAYLKLYDEVYEGLSHDGELNPRPVSDSTAQAATATLWVTWEKKRLL
jgi:hypothetical protein